MSRALVELMGEISAAVDQKPYSVSVFEGLKKGF